MDAVVRRGTVWDTTAGVVSISMSAKRETFAMLGMKFAPILEEASDALVSIVLTNMKSIRIGPIAAVERPDSANRTTSNV